MKPAGRIACMTILSVLLAGIIMARPGHSGQTENLVDTTAETEIHATATYIDPDLESILAVKDIERYDFLSRLSPDEQRELARIIKQRVDDEVGVIVSLMTVVSRFVPAFVAAPFTKQLEPATVARISDKVSTSKAVAIARRLEPEFLAEVAVYQDPEKVTTVVEGLPDQLLLDVTRVMIENHQYRKVAEFSDNMDAERLRSVTAQIDDPTSLVRIARYMENREKVVKTAATLSDDYMLAFMKEISSGNDYEMAAAVGRTLDTDRQINILNRLEPDQAARLAAHYPPETIVLIMEKADPERLADIAPGLSPETLGHVYKTINPRLLNRFIQTISRKQLLTVLPHIDLMRLENFWPELAPETRTILRDISREYPLLEEVILFIEGDNPDR